MAQGLDSGDRVLSLAALCVESQVILEALNLVKESRLVAGQLLDGLVGDLLVFFEVLAADLELLKLTLFVLHGDLNLLLNDVLHVSDVA